ncbi:hypothetical protein KP509_28G012600 [Ceratopteris richardii]|nr:hypothetical protein KP509_28G012600 [Ceratopteris richardii]
MATITGDPGSHISSLVILDDYLYAGTGCNGVIGVRTDSVRVWQKTTMREGMGFGAGYAPVKALFVSGNFIFSAHQDQRIRIWSRSGRTPSLKQVSDGYGHSSYELLQDGHGQHKLIASMPTMKDYVKAFIAPRNYVQVRRQCKRLWIEHVDTISMLAIGGSAEDPILYSASWDRSIKVWRLSDWKCLESFKAHDDAINALLVGPEGLLYTASSDAKIKVWGRLGGSEDNEAVQTQRSKKTRKHFLIASLEAHKASVNALALLKETNGNELALYSGGCDKDIVVWEREHGLKVMVSKGILKGHRKAILCLSSTGNFLCSGSADRTIRVWRRSRASSGGVSSHCCVAILQGHCGPIKCLAMSFCNEDHCLLYSSSLDNQLKVWKLDVSIKFESANDEEGDLPLNHQVTSLIAPWRLNSF